MKASFSILKHDVLALVKNPIALFVVLALLVLPGLYAWYCILANWDPYGDTGRMPIAVVNLDKGAKNDIAGEVNIGKQVSDQLKGNEKLDWRFYDSEEEALEDTKTAAVYATLVLPEDLSENVLGIIEGSDKRPTIYYYPNEKYSAVATKVTDSAAQTLVRQINQGFSSTVNKALLAKAQDASDNMKEKYEKGKKSAKAEIQDIKNDLNGVIASLDDAASSIAGWRTAASDADAALGVTIEQLPQIRSLLDQGSAQLDSLRTKTGDFESNLSSSILRSASSISNLSAKSSAELKKAVEDLRVLQERLKALEQEASELPDIQRAIEDLESIIALIDTIVKDADARVSELDTKVQDTANSVSTATTEISNDVMPKLNAGSYELVVSFSELSGAIAQFEPQIQQLRSILAQTDAALVDATGAIEDAKTLLTTINNNLNDTAADIGAINEALQVKRAQDLLEVDPENVGTFLSSPVQMVTEEIYPVSNYGTAVAPFYTNLALWVGCFILASLLKVEVVGFEETTARQRYFGRWMLFMLLALPQSQVICGVDILLGIDCANPGLFMLSGAVCSFAYMNIIFALIKTCRNVGKTFCILLLIMQVPGSSGMYPIQMMPDFFQAIHPWLPFTYGIDAMREALCGMSSTWRYVGDLLMILLLVPIALAIGLLVRPLMANLLQMFDEELNKTGYFSSEEYVPRREKAGVRGMLRALASHAAYADDIEMRAWKFNRMYPRVRRLGSIAVFAIPFAFLVILLFVNIALKPPTDIKLTALMIMIILLLVALLGLVVLEYTHRSIIAETNLLGAAILDEFDMDAPLAPSEGKEAGEAGGDAGEAGEAGGEAERENAATAPAPAPADAADEAAIPAAALLDKLRGSRRSANGPTFDIFRTDMRLGFRSVIGVVVIMLLVITPSMYAWFNIASSWNPYGSTGHLKVAVANSDKGYKGDLLPVTMNIGNTVVSQLRGNNSFDWVFVEEDEAIAGVESSEYYAAIVVPEDFSSNMLTYLTDDAAYPNVYYYTNEKENPIAPIITQKGADSIQESIRVSFTESVDSVALGLANDVLAYITDPKVNDYVVKMGRHLDDATHDVKTAARELRSLSGLSSTVASIVDTTRATLDGIKAAGDSAKVSIGHARSGVSEASAAFGQATAIVQGMLDNREIDVSKIQQVIDTVLAVIESGSSDISAKLGEAITIVEYLRDHATIIPKEKFDSVIDTLKAGKQSVDDLSSSLGRTRTETSSFIQEASADVAEVKDYFQGTVKPSIDELSTTLHSVTESTSEIIGHIEGSIGGIGDSTTGLSNQLNSLSGGLSKASDKLDSAATSVEDTKNRVANALKSGNLKMIEDVILGGDTEAMAASLAVPIAQERSALYPVENFGSNMAPFYTVLSLWVGALVMVSTMHIPIAEKRIEELRQRFDKLRPRHEFFGRYGIFGFIGMLQSSLVLLGDLMFLHIQCVHPILFFIMGVFVGQVFCLMVYTISELFGNVGKALCVILLIMQVAASGGTFPVQMLHPLLSEIVPFLPFHHAMTMLQECVAGIYWPSVGVSCLALLIMVGFILLIGVPLRRPFRKVNEFLEGQLERTGYM